MKNGACPTHIRTSTHADVDVEASNDVQVSVADDGLVLLNGAILRFGSDFSGNKKNVTINIKNRNKKLAKPKMKSEVGGPVPLWLPNREIFPEWAR